jgi:hypothetical protein
MEYNTKHMVGEWWVKIDTRIGQTVLRTYFNVQGVMSILYSTNQLNTRNVPDTGRGGNPNSAPG